MRNSDHETRFCGRVGGGLRHRIYPQLCPWRLWAWRRLSWRLRAQSYDTPRIASTADVRFSKPDSRPARGPYAAARHQWAVGAASESAPLTLQTKGDEHAETLVQHGMITFRRPRRGSAG